MFHEMIRGAPDAPFKDSVLLPRTARVPYPHSSRFSTIKKQLCYRSGEIEAIKVHHLGPGCEEVLDKLQLPVRASIDLGQSPELGVRTEYEIDTRAGPPDFASLAIAPFKQVPSIRYRLPFRTHIKHIHKEIVGQRLGPLREDAVPGLSEVSVEHPHPANEHRHLGCGQGQQLRLVNQQLLRRCSEFAPEVIAESVRLRLEYGKGRHIGLFLQGVHASRGEGSLYCMAGIPRCLLDTGAAGQDNQVGERYLLAAFLRLVEGALNLFQELEHLCKLRRLVDCPVLLRR